MQALNKAFAGFVLVALMILALVFCTVSLGVVGWLLFTIGLGVTLSVAGVWGLVNLFVYATKEIKK